MPEVTIRFVKNQSDLNEVRRLCLDWLDWHWNAYPDDWPREGNPMDPDDFRATLNELEKIHARPLGGMLLAALDGRAVGCVMYNQAESGVAEFFRMYVSDDGRGHGIGRIMLEHMFECMVADGYEKVRFSSAKFLTHARSMYEAAGFTSCPHPESFPEQWRPYVYFMERDLLKAA